MLARPLPHLALFTIVLAGAPTGVAQHDFEDLEPREVFERIEELEQMLMSGGPAPEWSAKTLEGEEITLADLEGDIVLMDFWATWCPPCVRAMPQIQEIHEEYADRGVVVLGMNQDRGNNELVERFIDARDLTFMQVMDADGSIKNDFGVTGIPTTFIVDRSGNVVHRHVGFGPTMKDELVEVIDRLLDGESLALDADRREEVESELDALREHAETMEGLDGFGFDGFGEETIELDEIGVEAFPLERAEDVEIAGWQPFRLDADGDGVLDFAVAGAGDGRLSIISGKTGEIRQIRLRDTDGLGGLWDLGALKVDGARHFIASFDDIGVRDSHNIALFSAQERVWVYRPEVPDGVGVDCNIASADLDGDGTPEIIVSLNMWGEGDMVAFGSGVDVLSAEDGTLIARHNLPETPEDFIVVPNPDGGEVVMMLMQGELVTLSGEPAQVL